MCSQPRFLIAGDRAAVVEFGDKIDEELNKTVRDIFSALQQETPDGITEMVPTYRSLLIYYDPLKITFNDITKIVNRLLQQIEDIPLPAPQIFNIPVLYGGNYGPDLSFVALHNKMSEDEVIRIHSQGIYRIFMLGFTPGFCYLGGMDPAIAAPRLENPRLKIPAGSVGIAGEQTGIYPIDSPGGWRLIGITPLGLFNPTASSPFLLSAGNYLRFVSIDKEEFASIEEQVKRGEYILKSEEAGWWEK